MDEEKKLLSGEEELEEDEENQFTPPPPSYDSVQADKPPLPEEDSPPPSSNRVAVYLHAHREHIPGYGVLRMVKGVRVYALYVLLMMLGAYLLNQLDRYTLPIVTSDAGYDLKYGDLECMKIHNKTAVEDVPENVTDLCTSDLYKHNKTECNAFNDTVDNITYYSGVCEYAHTGSGLLYQVVAGPVFNNLYPFAGIFTGFLADYGRRTIWLVIAVTFWSVATGLTGFAQHYWHLVVLRALLAIGAAGCTPFAVSILGDYFPPEFRGTAMGFYYFGIYIGYSLAFAIGNNISEVLNWRWVFFISALIGLALAPIILITVREPKRTKNTQVDTTTTTTTDDKPSFVSRVLSLLITFIMPGMFMLCIAGGIRNAGGYVWAYNTQLFFHDTRGFSKSEISRWMSWIPLVGGSLGAIVGGAISDVLVKGRSPYMRIWVLIFSQFFAAPFAAGALFLPYPWCFLSLIPSNVIGEMWVGVTTAIVVDLAPSKIRTGAVGLYLFIITVIGGNFNLLVSPIKNGFSKHLSDLLSYQLTLLLTFPGLYVISSALFVLTFFLMKFDLTFKSRLERRGGLSVNVNEAGVGDEEGQDKDGESIDKAV